MVDPALNVLVDLPRPGAGRRIVTSAVPGLDALYLTELLRETAASQILYVARDGVRANQLAQLIGFFAPEQSVALLPAWDCLPYDRASPSADIMAMRLETLGRLLEEHDRPRLVITTVTALVQKAPPQELRTSRWPAWRNSRRARR